MTKTPRKIYPVYVTVDLIIFGLSLLLVSFLQQDIPGSISIKGIKLFSSTNDIIIYLLWAAFLIFSLKKRNLYVTDRGLNIPTEIFRVIVSIVYASIVISGIVFLVKHKSFSQQNFLRIFLLLCLFLPGWRTLKRLVLRKLVAGGYHNINILIVGANRLGELVKEEINRHPHLGLLVAGFLDCGQIQINDRPLVLGKLSDFSPVVKRYFIDEVIIAIPLKEVESSNLMEEAKKLQLGVRVVPENFEQGLPVISSGHIGMLPLLTYKERDLRYWGIALKRIIDFIIALVILVFLFPLFIIVAILIKFDSKGPIFYIQKRVGYRGKSFNFYKFRSMVKEADSLKAGLLDKNDSKGNIIFKMKKDPRITRIGKFLRRYSLDEFPQIFNVLKGDMSLVGPRPFPVEESQSLEQVERFSVRPGITGLAQIKGRSDLSIYHWIKWDLWYVNNWSLGFDLLILWWTIPTVFRGKGAY